MNFKDWLNMTEGFGINYDNLPGVLNPNQYDPKAIETQKSSLLNQMYQSNAIIFNAKDRPQDFIKVDKLNTVQTLNINPHERLPSFEGATILYGMKFTTAGEQISRDSSKKIKELQTELENLRKTLSTKRLNSNASNAAKKVIIDEYDRALNKGATLSSMKMMLPDMINRQLISMNLAKAPWTWEKIKKVIDSINNPIEDGRSKLEKKCQVLEQEIQELTLRKESKNKFLNIAQQAFLKKIKFPSSPEDQQLADQFIQLAVNNYKTVRTNYPYDYVVYPESRSELNSKIALALASAYNAKPIQGFEKLQNPQIDTASYRKLNPDRNPVDRNNDMASLRKFVNNSNGQIKYVQKHRPFVRNWQLSSDLTNNVNPNDELSGLKNRRILQSVSMPSLNSMFFWRYMLRCFSSHL